MGSTATECRRSVREIVMPKKAVSGLDRRGQFASGGCGMISSRRLANVAGLLEQPSTAASSSLAGDQERELLLEAASRLSGAMRPSASSSPLICRNQRRLPAGDDDEGMTSRRSSDVLSARGRGRCGESMQISARPWDVAIAPATAAGDAVTAMGDLYDGLMASRELVKAIAHVCGPGALHPAATSLLGALHDELDRARAHAGRLIRERGAADGAAEEMKVWKRKEKEKHRSAVQAMVMELEVQKKLQKRGERMNRKLGAALAEAEAELREATASLERERRSRERLERICEELIRGIGDDKREIARLHAELQRESDTPVRFAVAGERADAKRRQVEDRNTAIEQLRTELQAFLIMPKDDGRWGDGDKAESVGSEFELEVDGGDAGDRELTAAEGGGGSDGVLEGETDRERYEAVKALREHLLAVAVGMAAREDGRRDDGSADGG